jgi:hypothetical protein
LKLEKVLLMKLILIQNQEQEDQEHRILDQIPKETRQKLI